MWPLWHKVYSMNKKDSLLFVLFHFFMHFVIRLRANSLTHNILHIFILQILTMHTPYMFFYFCASPYILVCSRCSDKVGAGWDSFLSHNTWRLAVGWTQPLVQWIPRTLPWHIDRPFIFICPVCPHGVMHN